jgi:hypothetical protein
VFEQAAFEALIVSMLGCLLSELFLKTWWGFVPFAVAGLVHGARRGRRLRRDVCSDKACEAELAPALSRCSRCGGEIMGHLRPGDDRLAMQEKFFEEARRRGSS